MAGDIIRAKGALSGFSLPVAAGLALVAWALLLGMAARWRSA
jgi:hypothetical protein